MSMGSGSVMTPTVLLAASVLSSCGDSGSSSPTQPAGPTAAGILVTANGTIVVHPSAEPGFGVALEIPIQIRETLGGSATWNFFAISWFFNGRQVERNQVGPNDIRATGFADIGPNSTASPVVLVRTNVDDFDDLDILLGFTDTNTGASFQRMLSLEDFEGSILDLTPALLPNGSEFRIIGSGGSR